MSDFNQLSDNDIIQRMRILSDSFDVLKPKLEVALVEYDKIMTEHQALCDELEKRHTKVSETTNGQ